MAPWTEGEAAKVTISFLSLQKESRNSMKHDNEIPHISRQIGSSIQKRAAMLVYDHENMAHRQSAI